MLIAPDGTAKLTDFGVSVIMTNNMDTVLPPGPNDTCATFDRKLEPRFTLVRHSILFTQLPGTHL